MKEKTKTEIIIFLTYILVSLVAIFYAGLKETYEGYWYLIAFFPLCFVLYDWATLRITKLFTFRDNGD